MQLQYTKLLTKSKRFDRYNWNLKFTSLVLWSFKLNKKLNFEKWDRAPLKGKFEQPIWRTLAYTMHPVGGFFLHMKEVANLCFNIVILITFNDSFCCCSWSLIPLERWIVCKACLKISTHYWRIIQVKKK